MKTVKISISRIVGGGICVSALDGQKVYGELYSAISSGERAEISFYGITRMTTAFLNAAVGQLYGEFDGTVLQRQLAAPVDFEDWHLKRLKLVVERAKSYFQDRERIESAFTDDLDSNNG